MKSSHRYTAAALALTLVISLAITGCGQQADAPDDQPQAVTFTFATSQEPSTLDPAAVYDGSDRITRLVYESLLQYKEATGEVEPALAETYDVSPDGKTYTFKLREDVTFHDGTPFNAEAVKFSFDRMLELGKGLAWAFEMVMDEDSVQVVDEYEVKFVLKKPYPAFLGMVASRYGAPIISPSVADHEKDGDLGAEWAKENTIGTGPYMLDEWVRNQEVVLEKNPSYWRGWEGEHFDRVVMKIVPEPSTQRMLLEQGEILAATHITVDDIAALRDNPNIRIEQPEKSNFGFFIGMNCNSGVFQDKKVREALSYAFPYEDTVDKAFLGQASRAVGPLPAAIPGHNPDIKVFETDVEKAKQLLAEAGYPGGGFTAKVTYMQGQDAGTRIFNVLAATLTELGIKVEAQPLTWSAMVDQLTSQDTAPDLVIGDWWDDYPDPDSYLGGMTSSFFWTSEDPANQFYSNDRVKEILGEAAFEPDTARRNELYSQVQELLIEDIPAVWVLDQLQPMAMRANVKGYQYNPYYLMTFNVYDMYLE